MIVGAFGVAEVSLVANFSLDVASVTDGIEIEVMMLASSRASALWELKGGGVQLQERTGLQSQASTGPYPKSSSSASE